MTNPLEGRTNEPVAAEAPTPKGMRLGKYQIIRRLGQGGLGVVYVALDTVLERQVAIKVLPRLVAGNPAML